MPIIRAHDPKTNDFRHQVLTRLGKLCDGELSAATKRRLVDELTTLLKGTQLNAELFKRLGVAYREDAPLNGERTIAIQVPKEFVSASITDDRENQWVEFTIAKELNLTNLKDHPIIVESRQ